MKMTYKNGICVYVCTYRERETDLVYNKYIWLQVPSSSTPEACLEYLAGGSCPFRERQKGKRAL